MPTVIRKVKVRRCKCKCACEIRVRLRENREICHACEADMHKGLNE